MVGTLTSATVGIENASGNDGLQVVYNAAYVSNGLAVKISSDPDWLANDITSGTIYNGNSLDMVLTFSSEDYPTGIYSMDVVISSNDPLNPVITVPVTMEIKIFSELTSFKALIEGLFDGTSMVPDTVTVELRSASFPYNLIDEAKIFLNSSGEGSGQFDNLENGTPYYLVVKHRNALETWSASGQIFTDGSLEYDFTASPGKAYGNNLVLKEEKWCIYSGDVNKDGFIDAADLNLVFNDNINGAEGYIATDLNGDMFTEIDDVNIIFINNVLGIERKRPVDFPLE
jgi:hypothetical protein